MGFTRKEKTNFFFSFFFRLSHCFFQFIQNYLFAKFFLFSFCSMWFTQRLIMVLLKHCYLQLSVNGSMYVMIYNGFFCYCLYINRGLQLLTLYCRCARESGRPTILTPLSYGGRVNKPNLCLEYHG